MFFGLFLELFFKRSEGQENLQQHEWNLLVGCRKMILPKNETSNGNHELNALHGHADELC